MDSDLSSETKHLRTYSMTSDTIESCSSHPATLNMRESNIEKDTKNKIKQQLYKSTFNNTSECFNVSVMIGIRLLICGTCSLSPVLASLISSIRALLTSSEPLSFEGADNTAVI